MSVGDINSSAKGSGARLNDGKPPVELLLWREVHTLIPEPTMIDCRFAAWLAMRDLGEFQETHEIGKLKLLLSDLYMGNLRKAMIDGSRVFDYGTKKYVAWNWAKGMPWSVVVACAGRHLLAIYGGEYDDPESQLPHAGHVVCNVMMLSAYKRLFPEGNDLPNTGLFLEKSAVESAPVNQSESEKCQVPPPWPPPFSQLRILKQEGQTFHLGNFDPQILRSPILG